MDAQRFLKTTKAVPFRTIEQTTCPRCLTPTATLIQTLTDLEERSEIACHECHYYWDNTVFVDLKQFKNPQDFIDSEIRKWKAGSA